MGVIKVEWVRLHIVSEVCQSFTVVKCELGSVGKSSAVVMEE